MNYSNDANQLSNEYNMMVVAIAASVIDSALNEYGYVSLLRRELADYYNLMLMGAEMG